MYTSVGGFQIHVHKCGRFTGTCTQVREVSRYMCTSVGGFQVHVHNCGMFPDTFHKCGRFPCTCVQVLEVFRLLDLVSSVTW